MIAVRAFSDYLGNDAVQNWIVKYAATNYFSPSFYYNLYNSYRDLLNTWRMYLERADFDIMLAQIKSREKPLRQVYISCNYCGKSVSASMQGFSQERGQYQRASSSTPVKVCISFTAVFIIFLCIHSRCLVVQIVVSHCLGVQFA